MRAGRVAVLSDVHGNAVALAAVLAEVAAEGCDLVVFGGDLTWGPLPRETLELVRPLERALFVRGNAERELLSTVDGRSGDPSAEARWQARAHSTEDVQLVRTFAFEHVVDVEGLGAVRICHGSPRADNECVTPLTPVERIRELSEGMAERVLVTAHIHVQFDRVVDGLRSLNAGSVGLAYEGRPGAYWAILGPGVEHRRTEYDLDEAVRRYRASGDPAAETLVELLLAPAGRDEAIEHAESLVFSD